MNKFSRILFLGVLIVFETNAQTQLTNPNSVIAVQNGAIITIQGNLSSTGRILNEGELRLTGDWTEAGTYESVSGTLILNGQDQRISHQSQNFSSLTISGGGVKTITSTLSITSTLELIDGIVALSENTLTMDQDTQLIGGDDSSYIQGTLAINQQGDIFFPIGDGSLFLPVSLFGSSSIGPVSAEAIDESLTNDFHKSIDELSPSGYWKVSGDEFLAQGIELPFNQASFIDELESATIAFSLDELSRMEILGTVDIQGSLSAGSIVSSANIASGVFSLAKLGSADPPINVINVITTLQDGKHDFLRIENIEFYENNTVEIFDRQGKKVFSMSDYNNQDRVFRGQANMGNGQILATGSYYYTVKLGTSKREAGFVYIKN